MATRVVTSENPTTDGVHTQHSTEELCKEAAEKLGNICSTTGKSHPTPNYLAELQRQQKANNPGFPGHPTTNSSPNLQIQFSNETPPPPYTQTAPCSAALSACQIPLTDPERRDFSTSIVVPPAPPPSPGIALISANNQADVQLTHHANAAYTFANPSAEFPLTSAPQAFMVEQAERSNPSYHMSPYSYTVPNPAVFPPHGQPPYVISAPPPQIVCIQAPQQPAPAPTTSQNVNTNIVIENKIGGDEDHIPDYQSYIAFSVFMFLLCLVCNPVILLLCVLPACIASLVVCCDSRQRSTHCGRRSQKLALRQAERNKCTGDFALACNIIGLICGLFGVIIVAIMVPLAYLSFL